MSRNKYRVNLVNDYHHILFQGKHWNSGHAKELRSHPYCGAYIPKYTLHQLIHAKVSDVPVPSGKECRRVIRILNEWLSTGHISLKHSLYKKLSVLAELFRRRSPATAECLDRQKEVVIKFYEGH